MSIASYIGFALKKNFFSRIANFEKKKKENVYLILVFHGVNNILKNYEKWKIFIEEENGYVVYFHLKAIRLFCGHHKIKGH